MPPDAPEATPIATLAAALLRTAAWLYGALWVIVAATSPWGPPGLLPVVVLLPLAPLVMLATVRALSRRPPPARPPSRPDLGLRAQAFLSAPLTPPEAPQGRSAP